MEREIAYQNQMLSDQASEIDSIKLSMNDKQEETVPSTEELIESTTEETTSVEEGKLMMWKIQQKAPLKNQQ